MGRPSDVVLANDAQNILSYLSKKSELSLVIHWFFKHAQVLTAQEYSSQPEIPPIILQVSFHLGVVSSKGLIWNDGCEDPQIWVEMDKLSECVHSYKDCCLLNEIRNINIEYIIDFDVFIVYSGWKVTTSF